MEAISKKSGKKFTGKVAALMLRIGVATPVEDSSEELLTDENTEEPTSDNSNLEATEEEVTAAEPMEEVIPKPTKSKVKK
jgi:hypothetical protein